MADSQFGELIQKVRSGDEEAAAQLVKLYEPAIRRAVRLRMGDSRLQAAFDSMDICQSVMASFFVRAAAGQYEIDTAQELIGLLVAMARKKLAMQIRKQRAAKRDQRRQVASPNEDLLEGQPPSPSRQLMAKELLDQVMERLTQEEQQLIHLRNQGLSWQEISDKQPGTTPDGLRIKLSRAIDRIATELKVEELLE